MQSQAKLADVGGGMMAVGPGCHRAEARWTDVLLIEKAELTWRAAGQSPVFIDNCGRAKIHRNGDAPYPEQAKRAGLPTGRHGRRAAVQADATDRICA